MKFLLDTNVIIPAEPTSQEHVEKDTQLISTFLGLASEGGHQCYLHPESRKELEQDKNVARKYAREKLLDKYPILPQPPALSETIRDALGDKLENRHNLVDATLLSAVESNAVHYLVTNDRGIHKNANKLGLSERVTNVDDAISIIRSLFLVTPVPPPAVHSLLAHELDIRDPIFLSFRQDYPDFDHWLKKCALEHRQVWTIKINNSLLSGICIVKQEDKPDYDIGTPTLKICSFKIADSSRGLRYGELLLKTVFEYAFQNSYSSLYVETFDKQSALMFLLETHGFKILDNPSSKGEMVLCKKISYSNEEYNNLSPLDFHILFGPRHIKLEGTNSFIIPIKPQYHQLLFPEVEPQMELLPGKNPFGNSIRKAYLCHSPIRRIAPGDVVFFYRSTTQRGAGLIHFQQTKTKMVLTV